MHAFLMDYFQVVSMFLVFSFLWNFSLISVCIISFYLQIVSSWLFAHHQHYRIVIKNFIDRLIDITLRYYPLGNTIIAYRFG